MAFCGIDEMRLPIGYTEWMQQSMSVGFLARFFEKEVTIKF